MEFFRRHYRRLIELTLLLTLCVVALGAYTRLSDAGLGCPDWPGCYGQLWAPDSLDEASPAYQQAPARPFDAAAARIEMAHRLLAGILGLGLIALATMAGIGRLCRPTLAVALIVLLACQVILGMLTVTWQLKPIVVCAHLLFAIALAMTLWQCHLDDRSKRPTAGAWLSLHSFASRSGGARLPPTAQLALALVGLFLLAQIFLGVWMSSQYASLACADEYPLCHGQWLPPADFSAGFTLWQGVGADYEFGRLDSEARIAIHLSHRYNALALITVALLALALLWRQAGPATRRCSLAFLAILALQSFLGIANVMAGLPIANAVAHTVLASLLALCWQEWQARARAVG